MGEARGSQGTFLVGVVSDTHGTLDVRACGVLAECDHIIHAGDIGNPGVLRELQNLAPVTAVLGNNDFDEYGSQVQQYARPVIAGVRFLVAHYPEDVRMGALGSKALGPGSPIPDVCIHGHTHVPRLLFGNDARPASYVLNPGALLRPRQGSPRSLAKIVLADGQVQSIRIESLDGDLLKSCGL